MVRGTSSFRPVLRGSAVAGNIQQRWVRVVLYVLAGWAARPPGSGSGVAAPSLEGQSHQDINVHRPAGERLDLELLLPDDLEPPPPVEADRPVVGSKHPQP